MIVTIINDCRDANAAARQQVRAQSIFGTQPNFLGVTNDIEAAGHLIDILDAADGKPSVILVNIAPRNGKAKKWPNGTPFGYFYVGKTIVGTTIDGQALSLIKKFGLTDKVYVFDTPAIVDLMIKDKFVDKSLRNHIVNNQFRSYEFLPRAIAYVMKKGKIKNIETIKIEDTPDAPAAVWFVDNFGNCKTTLLPEDINFQAGKSISIGKKKVTMYNRLKDVPNKSTGIIIGSSGIGESRFVEIVRQGASAGDFFKLAAGSLI